MANHQVNITENGTKILLTVGKYCDRNIDVNVDVPAKPTQFTNILELDTTIVKPGYRVASNSYIETEDGVALVFPVTAGTHKIRVRGPYLWPYVHLTIANNYGPWYSNFYETTTQPSGDTFSGTLTHCYADGDYVNQDEYGDWYFAFTASNDCYIGFTLKDMTVTYPEATYNLPPIVTLDEPIGNGGIV